MTSKHSSRHLTWKASLTALFKSSVGLKAFSPFSGKFFSLIQSKLIWLFYWHTLFVVAVKNISLRWFRFDVVVPPCWILFCPVPKTHDTSSKDRNWSSFWQQNGQKCIRDNFAFKVNKIPLHESVISKYLQNLSVTVVTSFNQILVMVSRYENYPWNLQITYTHR